MSFPFTETPDDYERYPLDVLLLLSLNIAHPEVPSCMIGMISVAHSSEVAPCYVQVALCGNWMTDSDGARIDPGFWELTGEDAEEVAELASAATEAQRAAADPSKPIAQVGEILRKIGDVLGEVPSNADAAMNILMDIDSGKIPINLPAAPAFDSTEDFGEGGAETLPAAFAGSVRTVPLPGTGEGSVTYRPGATPWTPSPYLDPPRRANEPDDDARDMERLRSAP